MGSGGFGYIMQNEILEEIKIKLEKLKITKKGYQQILSKLEELQKNRVVKEYLQLLQDLNTIDLETIKLDDDDILPAIYREFLPNISNTNNIWVFIGSFDYAPLVIPSFDSKNFNKFKRKKDIIGEVSDKAREALTLDDLLPEEKEKEKQLRRLKLSEVVRIYDHEPKPSALFHLYKNIEDNSEFRADFLNLKKFEQEHIIIYPGEIDFSKLQNEFYKLAVEQGQEEACKQILERYKSNIEQKNSKTPKF